MTWIDHALKYQPLLALFFTVGFMVIYASKNKWWKYAMGRHMMGFMAGAAIVLTVGVIVRLVPTLDNIKQIRFWSWNLVIAIFAWRFWVAVQVWILKNFSDLKRIHEEDPE